ncbi:hypothetical protein GOBAR_AA27534 [Gossypium barbadense]|uniref:Methyltransferase n=1 Tax=Gossypium barbadense TaxID=3634 RepID=A0A2P5WPX3_GOSBA|nr:hypothetical protein GOBAR_AA27534 [Gossypium barbadense]
MAREYSGLQMHHQLEAKRKRLTWILGVSALCILFYVLGAWQTTPSSQYDVYTRVGCDNNSATSDSNDSIQSLANLDFASHHQVALDSSKTISQFPPCDMAYSEYTPCQDKVASFGAYLLKRNILTMSFAPRDTHEAQVQFALERGVPAMIGIIGSMRLPYPARAFDLAHCSRCLIPWQNNGGLYLMEVDRILRAGGYWILSGPPINWKKYWRGWERTKEDLKQEQDAIENVARRLCWKKVTENNDLAIWQKPINHVGCVKEVMCKSEDPDTAWYRSLEACITPVPQVVRSDEVAGGELLKWPERAFAVPPRLSRGSVPGLGVDRFIEDNEQWKDKIAHYNRIIAPLRSGRYRNIMDMNAYLGGFAAAVAKYPVWVMNVIPAHIDYDTLGVIYERGLIGTYQDWCEAFSTYPRTYDLIHASGLFTLYQHRCDITYILLEMDRILRPEGSVIFRDTVELLVKIKSITDGMRWKSHIVDHESGPFNPEKILVAVKTYWTGEATKKKPK